MTDCCLCVCWRPRTHRRLIRDIFQASKLSRKDPKLLPSKSKIEKLASYLAIYPAQLSTITFELNQILTQAHRKGHIGYVVLTIEIYRSILKKFTEHSIAYLLETSLNVVLHDILSIPDLFYLRAAALLIKECSKSEVFTTNLTFFWALLELPSLVYTAEDRADTPPFGTLSLSMIEPEKINVCFIGLTIMTSLMPKINQHATWFSTFLPAMVDLVLNVLSISTSSTAHQVDVNHPHPLAYLEEEDVLDMLQHMSEWIHQLNGSSPNTIVDMAWALVRAMATTSTPTVIADVVRCFLQSMGKYNIPFACKLSIQVLYLVQYTYAKHNEALDLKVFVEAQVLSTFAHNLFYSISLPNQVEQVQHFNFLLDGSESFYAFRDKKLMALTDMAVWMEKHVEVVYTAPAAAAAAAPAAAATGEKDGEDGNGVEQLSRAMQYPVDHKVLLHCFQSMLSILVYVLKVHPSVCCALPKQIQALLYDGMQQSPVFTQTFESFAQWSSAYLPSEDMLQEDKRRKLFEKRLQQRNKAAAEQQGEEEGDSKEDREDDDDDGEDPADELASFLINKLVLILCKLSEKTAPLGGSVFTILTKLFEEINFVAQERFVEYVAPTFHSHSHAVSTAQASMSALSGNNAAAEKRGSNQTALPAKIGMVSTVRKNHILQYFFIFSHYLMAVVISRMTIDHKAVLLTNTVPPALLSNESWGYLMNMFKSFSHFEGRRGILHFLAILMAVSQPLILPSNHYQRASSLQGGAVFELELYKQLLLPQASSNGQRQKVANYFFYPFSANQMHTLYSTMFEDVVQMQCLFGLRVSQWWNLMVILLQTFGHQAVLTSLPVFVTMLSRIEHAESLTSPLPDATTLTRIRYWKVFVLSYFFVIARMYFVDELEHLIQQYYQHLPLCDDLTLDLEDSILRFHEAEHGTGEEAEGVHAGFVANPVFAGNMAPSSSQPSANSAAHSNDDDAVKLSIKDIKRKLLTCHIFQAYSFEINKAFDMEFIPYDASNSMLRDTMVLVANFTDNASTNFTSLDQFNPTNRKLFGDDHDHHSETGSVVSRGSNASSKISKRSRTSSKNTNKPKVTLPNHHHHQHVKHNYTEGYTILSSKLMTESSSFDDASRTDQIADSSNQSNNGNSSALLYPVLPQHIRTHAWRETFYKTNAHIHQRLEQVPPEHHFSVVTEEFVHLLNELSAE